MSQRKSPVLPLLVLASLIAAIALWPSGDEAAQKDSQQIEILSTEDMSPLSNRIWIDRIPKDERTKIDVFLMFEEPTLGGFSRSSAYEGDWTTFEWEFSKGLHFHMLQSQKRHKITASVTKGASCKVFDYCLTIKGAPRGAKHYGSMEDWIIDEADQSTPSHLVDQLFFP